MSGAVHALRHKLREAKAEIARLKGQNAQEILDLAAQHPVIADTVVIHALEDLLESMGEKVESHDTLHHKIANIVHRLNAIKELYNEVLRTPASQMLKDALHVIGLWRKNTAGMHTAAHLFLDRPIIKALLKEMEAERSVDA